MKKKEVLLIAGILFLAAALWLAYYLLPGTCSTVRITVDGTLYGVWPLSEDQTIHIGDTNVCEIKNGRARMIETTCPDHLCEKQRAIGKHGGVIVCLPNRVIIEGIRTQAAPSDSGGIDAIAR